MSASEAIDRVAFVGIDELVGVGMGARVVVDEQGWAASSAMFGWTRLLDKFWRFAMLAWSTRRKPHQRPHFGRPPASFLARSSQLGSWPLKVRNRR